MEYKVFTLEIVTNPTQGSYSKNHDELLSIELNKPLKRGFQFVTLLDKHVAGDFTKYKCLYVKIDDATSRPT